MIAVETARSRPACGVRVAPCCRRLARAGRRHVHGR